MVIQFLFPGRVDSWAMDWPEEHLRDVQIPDGHFPELSDVEEGILVAPGDSLRPEQIVEMEESQVGHDFSLTCERILVANASKFVLGAPNDIVGAFSVSAFRLFVDSKYFVALPVESLSGGDSYRHFLSLHFGSPVRHFAVTMLPVVTHFSLEQPRVEFDSLEELVG